MNGRIIRVYADTSVYGGAFDDEFHRPSERFFAQVRSGRFRLINSPVVLQELEGAPANVQALFSEMIQFSETAGITDAALDLQEAYLAGGVVSRKDAGDALHVALATVSGCTLIVSWNFRHIVQFNRIRMYNAVNRLRGYPMIDIYSPLEVIHDEQREGL